MVVKKMHETCLDRACTVVLSLHAESSIMFLSAVHVRSLRIGIGFRFDRGVVRSYRYVD